MFVLVKKALQGVLLFSLMPALFPPTLLAAPPLAVIVNRDNPIARITVRQLKAVYEARRHFWRDGRAVVPVNREAGSITREEFSRLLLGRPSRGMNAYWNEKYFQGILPPLVLGSDEAVIRYVERTAGAVGYVPATSVDKRVKVILKLQRR